MKTLKLRASTLHDGNADTLVVEDAKTKVGNNQRGDTLIDPEDSTPGNTHTSIKASANNISQIENDVDPAAGYLTEAEDADVDTDTDDLPEDSEDEVDAADLDEKADLNGKLPQSVLEGDAEPDWDAEDDEDEDEVEACDTHGMIATDDESFIEDDDGDDVGDDSDENTGDDADEEDEDEPEVEADSQDLIDVDEADDEGHNVAFASLGTNMMVIKNNRIVASMNKRIATAAGHSDVYMSDQFQEVVASEINKKGLRAGLKNMGFSMSKVNVMKASVIKRSVKKQVQAATANIRKVNSDRSDAFQQSLAIASVGINRNYWKDVENPLKAALQDELQAAGVRNGSRIIKAAFAQHGVDYAKAIVTLANQLCNMPEETRNRFASALDMVNEDSDIDEDDSDEDDGEVDSEADDVDEDDFVDQQEQPNSVMASLATPGRKTARLLDSKASGYSVTAAAVLDGTAALPIY